MDSNSSKSPGAVVFITVTELRGNLPEILARVRLQNHQYIITKHGKRVATITRASEQTPTSK